MHEIERENATEVGINKAELPKSYIFKEFERELLNLKEILEEIGIYSFRKALNNLFDDLLTNLNSKRVQKHATVVAYIKNVFDLLKSIVDDCVKRADDELNTNEILELCSGKLHCLFDLFRERRALKHEADSKFHAIVFAERKLTVEYLADLFNMLSKSDEYSYLKSGFVVGNSTYAAKEAGTLVDEDLQRQRHVIQAFGLHKINILFATKVIEEGIDIPKCNMVVRYNLPKTFGSYYQSKGRARHKDSTFYFLVDKDAAENYLTDLKNFLQVENV